ncbi:MAG: UTP--glucose-1-phosphate uridylyltransferase [Planctomycetia bacterium]|nr:UTP--glucose-1-phosphate uridylyltransferase [Planctomycetia bacterium]
MKQYFPSATILRDIFQQYLRKDEIAVENQNLFRKIQPLGKCALLDSERLFGRSRCAEEAISAGKVGIVILAGGMGSRLGAVMPKGTFPVTPVREKSLFQVHFEKIRVLRERYKSPLRTYIMTNPDSDALTRDFLRENDFFGLPEEDVFLFSQGVMPALSPQDGSLFFLSDGRIYCGPDGHGGLITALENTDAGADMRLHGITTINTFHIDNPLVPILNEEMLAEHLHTGSEMSSVVVEKVDGMELVGNVVYEDVSKTAMRVVEYMDFPGEYAMKTDPDAGGLRFWAGSIGIHLIQLDFLEEMARKIRENPGFLPFHLPLKKIQTQDGPEWGIKPERFIFDILPLAKTPTVIRAVNRDEVFITLKQSAIPVREHLSELYASWLRRAGATLPENAQVEIAPDFALDFATLREKIPAGMIFAEEEVYLE